LDRARQQPILEGDGAAGIRLGDSEDAVATALDSPPQRTESVGPGSRRVLVYVSADPSNDWSVTIRVLTRNDIEAALLFFTEGQQPRYRTLFTGLSAQIAQIARDMQDLQLIYVAENRAKYRIRRPQLYAGQLVTFTYYIYFVQDGDGLWAIESF
jgi:hypothetical protein